MTDQADAPLTQVDFARLACKSLGCDHSTHGSTVIRATCHRHAAFTVSYFAGVLTVRCARCTQLVNQIRVAA